MAKSTVSRGLVVTGLGAPLLLAGCATRESVEQAQNTANAAEQHAAAADQHAGVADSPGMAVQARADEAYGVGNNALSSAQSANRKADKLQAGLIWANARISFLERHLMPKYFKAHHKVHHKRPVNPSGT